MPETQTPQGGKIAKLTRRIEQLAQDLTSKPFEADEQKVETFIRLVDERGQVLAALTKTRKEQVPCIDTS